MEPAQWPRAAINHIAVWAMKGAEGREHSFPFPYLLRAGLPCSAAGKSLHPSVHPPAFLPRKEARSAFRPPARFRLPPGAWARGDALRTQPSAFLSALPSPRPSPSSQTSGTKRSPVPAVGQPLPSRGRLWERAAVLRPQEQPAALPAPSVPQNLSDSPPSTPPIPSWGSGAALSCSWEAKLELCVLRGAGFFGEESVPVQPRVKSPRLQRSSPGAEGGIPRCYLWKGLKYRQQRLQLGARWLNPAVGERGHSLLPSASETTAQSQDTARPRLCLLMLTPKC